LSQPPGTRCNAAQRHGDAGKATHTRPHDRSCRNERELKRRAIPDFHISRRRRWRHAFDGSDQFTVAQYRLPPRGRSWIEIEIRDWDAALAHWSMQMEHGVERGERDGTIRGMHGLTIIAAADDGKP